MTTTTKPFAVIDLTTREIVGTYATIQRARAARDRKDMAYGCCHYGVIGNPMGGE